MSREFEGSQVENQMFIEELESRNEELREVNASLRGQIQRRDIVAYSKLTRRQQKQWPLWVNDVDLNSTLKLKETFAFPKIGVKFLSGKRTVDEDGNNDNSQLRYELTGLTNKDGMTMDEATEIAEYLNSFPENQHHLKNLDAEIRDSEVEEKLRAEMKK